jgi:hypothetical protein
MNRLATSLVLASAVAIAATGCTAASSGPAVDGADSSAYALWPTDVVAFPDIPVVERPERVNECFQPEGTYAICSADFDDSDENLAALDELFTEAGFDVTEGGNGTRWDYSKGAITVVLSRGGDPEPTLSLDLSDRS